jgi:hypothetical protein
MPRDALDTAETVSPRIAQVSCRDPARSFSAGFDSRRLHYETAAETVSPLRRVPRM